jgi:hypothetical protein
MALRVKKTEGVFSDGSRENEKCFQKDLVWIWRFAREMLDDLMPIGRNSNFVSAVRIIVRCNVGKSVTVSWT